MNEVAILNRLVRISSKALRMSKAFDEAGYTNNPYFDIHGDVADVIYTLLGEETDDYTKSTTNRILTSELFTDAQRVEALANYYKSTHLKT